VPGVTDDHSRPAEAEAVVPPRPRSMDPQEIGFTPQRMVGWLAPLLLLSTGLRALLAILFGAYLDKRELQNSLDGEWFDHSATADGEMWLDYVADLGDGFHSTYSVAWLLAQQHLTLDGDELPRGRLLLMGGDQVYPLASGDGYESRMKGPYRAALPEPPAGEPRPTLFALPGNHDWYDGLTAFLRLFARRKDGHIGGWRTQQRRSYFAVKLPGDWWLFAMDEQFGAYIDDPQLLYFEKAARLRIRTRFKGGAPSGDSEISRWAVNSSSARSISSRWSACCVWAGIGCCIMNTEFAPRCLGSDPCLQTECFGAELPAPELPVPINHGQGVEPSLFLTESDLPDAGVISLAMR